MILLIFALHCLHGLASTAPTGGIATTTLESADGSGVEIFRTNYRSTSQIVTTCITTILLCTWFTIHPDVCGSNSTWGERVKRKLELFVWALIMPELVMMWACNQWMAARKIRDKIGERSFSMSACWVAESLRGAEPRWTEVEGHFALMGGIRFTNKGKEEWMNFGTIVDPQESPADVLSFVEREFVDKELHTSMRQELRTLHKRITLDEITDRSKTDALSKTIVIVQTTWFAVQCIARAAQGLAITELEVVTLAYAVLNGVMCFFWWKKPLDVQCPVVIDLSAPQANSSSTEEPPSQTRATSSLEAQTLMADGDVKDPKSSVAKRLSEFNAHLPSPRDVPMALLKGVGKVFSHLLDSAWMLSCTDNDMRDTRDRFKGYAVQGDPSFYVSGILVSFLASVFGAIHCISWSFHFPSSSLQMLWRVCSMVITFSPLLLALYSALVWNLNTRRFSRWGHFRWFDWVLFNLNVYILAPLYIVARLILLGVAFRSLSSIPDTGHQSIEWAEFIPHI